jgi:hypothetical protein
MWDQHNCFPKVLKSFKEFVPGNSSARNTFQFIGVPTTVGWLLKKDSVIDNLEAGYFIFLESFNNLTDWYWIFKFLINYPDYK